ncbi:MAG: UvrD-helicase domain-containing protein [Chloroflexi bacterium]|nr:UvrD-helicase domain-containing protein [Chloroflexota bacterium]
MTDDLLRGLNDAQRAAVTAPDGPVLIIAGPGSGKTRVLTHRVAWLIRERDVAPWRICAVTFTNKAAREMRERLEHLIGDLARELLTGTFHALCARFLRQHGQEIGLSRHFTIFDDDDQTALVRQALKQLDLDPKQVTPRSMLVGISAAKSAGLGPDAYARRVENYRDELVARVYRIYQALLDHNKGLDFDDLLMRTIDLLDLPGGTAAARLPERIRHLLVDEYQDTNVVQFELVRRLSAGHGNTYVVGDPDQSIYAFRGATIRNILEFESAFPNAQIIRLEQNYRSTQAILRAAGAVIAENQERHKKELWTDNPEGQAITVKELYDEHHEAQWVAEQIRDLIDREDYRPSDIAVLYRTNAQSQPLEHALNRVGLSYQLIGGTKFYERKEIRDVLALLRLIVNPDDDYSLRRVVDAMPVASGLGRQTWLRLESWAAEAEMSVSGALAAWATPGATIAPPLTGRPAAGARALADLLARLRSRLGQDDVVTLFDQALADSGYDRLLREGTEPERLENVTQLRAELRRYLDLPLDAQLTIFLEEAALVAASDDLDDTRADKVTLITLHAAKGLEFPVVFIIGMEDGLLPHARSLGNLRELEEERRLAFVGITRARQRLYLTHAGLRSSYYGTNQQARSQFLTPLDVLADGGRGRGRARPGTTAPTRISGASQPGSGRASSAPRPQPAPRRPTSDFVDDAGQSEVVVTVAAGDRVRHHAFGVGVVKQVTPSRGDVQVTVDFGTNGTRTLMASMARLTPA